MENNFDLFEFLKVKQKQFNSNFINFENLSSEEKQHWSKEYILHMSEQAFSFLDKINWKLHHKNNEISINRRELLFEWIDIFKYWLSLGLVWDFTSDEFFSSFQEKSDIVEMKYLQENSSIVSKDVIICDIDGVLSDYPKTFLKYVDDREGTNFSNLNLEDLDLYKLPINSEKLKDYKYQYRISGDIRKEEVNIGALDFLNVLKNKGYYIVLLTSRPFSSYKTLYFDTVCWLKSHNLPFDMILSDGKKRDKVIELSKNTRIKFLIDDDPKIINNLSGITNLNRIYLLDKTYNQTVKDTDIVKRVKNFNEILNEENL